MLGSTEYQPATDWAFFGSGQPIPTSGSGNAEFEYAVSFDGSVITYEAGVKMFVWYGGLSYPVGDMIVAELETGDTVGFDVVVDTRFDDSTYGDGFGMRSENTMAGKYADAGQFQQYLLYSDPVRPVGLPAGGYGS